MDTLLDHGYAKRTASISGQGRLAYVPERSDVSGAHSEGDGLSLYLSRLNGSRPVGCVGAARIGAAGMDLMRAAAAGISTLSPWCVIRSGGPASNV